jgi:hypothetical protein
MFYLDQHDASEKTMQYRGALKMVDHLRTNNLFNHEQPVTPHDLIGEITDQIPLDMNQSIGVLFTVEWALYLKHLGYKNITLITDKYDQKVDIFASKVILCSYKLLTEIEEQNMKFDVVVGNPPYNAASSSKKTIAGTSGNTVLYKKFIDRFINIGKCVAMVVPLNGIRYAYKKQYSIECFSLETKKHWNYTAGWFISSKNNSKLNFSESSIFKKIYMLEEQWNYSSPLSGSYDSNIKKTFWETSQGNDVYGIVDTPSKKHNDCRWGWIKSPRTGAQLIFKGLESIHSYVATDSPSYAGSTGALFFDNIDEAEKAKLFILNNPAVKYTKLLTSEKTLAMAFRYMKRFDLSQIVTGREFPVEWQLTDEEITHIEEIVN